MEAANPFGLSLPSAKEREHLRAASYFAAFLCLVALVSPPMRSFYDIFRTVVCAVSLWQFWAAFRMGKGFAAMPFILAAVCFNPVWRIEVSGLPWKLAAVLAVILFLGTAARTETAPPAPPTS